MITSAQAIKSIVAALVVSGCTIVGHERVADWPTLVVTEKKVGYFEAQRICGKYVPWFMDAWACAEIDLNKSTCDIYYVLDFLLEHERLHCAGYDHIGGTTLQTMLNELKK